MKLDINFNNLKQKGFIYLENKTIIPYESQNFKQLAENRDRVAAESIDTGLLFQRLILLYKRITGDS